MNICPCDPHAPTYGAHYHCECVDDTYHHTKPESTFTLLGLDYQKAHQGPMGYQCTEYGPCSYCSSVTRGDRRKRLYEMEETEGKTKHHINKIYAGLHSSIDNLFASRTGTQPNNVYVFSLAISLLLRGNAYSCLYQSSIMHADIRASFT